MLPKNRRSKHWHDTGNDPDYRFSLANERTFLAWIRTSLAVLAGAMLTHQLYKQIKPLWLAQTLCIFLFLMSAALSWTAYSKWRANEIAMRHSNPLPHSKLLFILAIFTTFLAVALAATSSVF